MPIGFDKNLPLSLYQKEPLRLFEVLIIEMFPQTLGADAVRKLSA
jgi:hypothetical protein